MACCYNIVIIIIIISSKIYNYFCIITYLVKSIGYADVTLLTLVAIWRGSKSMRVTKDNYDKLPNYGEGKEYSNSMADKIVHHLVTQEILKEVVKATTSGFNASYIAVIIYLVSYSLFFIHIFIYFFFFFF